MLLDTHTAASDCLVPANEMPTALLPPLDQRASEAPTAGGSIRAVYDNGIEFIDQMGTLGGMFAGAVWAFILVLLVFGIQLAPIDSIDTFPLVFLLVWGCVLLALGRVDSVGWRYQPVLFDRATQKVHVFTDLGSPWWEIWRLLGGTRYRIDSFDFACARGEVAEVKVLGGNNMVRTEYALVLAITDSPGSLDVVARFGVGFTAAYDGGGTQIVRWEHIRRYMRDEGPALTYGDHLYPDESQEHWIGAFTSGQPLLGPGSKVWWTGEALHGAWPVTIPFGLAFLVLFPLTLPYSLIRWLVQRYKGTPRWPAEIQSSVGALVDPESLRPKPKRQYTGDYTTRTPPLTFKLRRAEAKHRKRSA